jgi:hypothetical protein
MGRNFFKRGRGRAGAVSAFEYHSDSILTSTLNFKKKLLEFLVDNMFIFVDDHVLQQFVIISMGTNCAPLLADLCLYSHEAEFIQKLTTRGGKKTLLRL